MGDESLPGRVNSMNKDSAGKMGRVGADVIQRCSGWKKEAEGGRNPQFSLKEEARLLATESMV